MKPQVAVRNTNNLSVFASCMSATVHNICSGVDGYPQ